MNRSFSIISLFFILSFAHTANADVKVTKEQLKTVDSAITQARESINSRRNRLDSIQQELQNTERLMSQYYEKLDQTNESIKKTDITIKRLQVQLNQLQRAHDHQIEALEAQMKAQYMLGQKHPLKNLLNSENTAKIDRLNKYAEILSEQRLLILEALKKTEQSLMEQKTDLQNQKNELLKLKEEQQLSQQKLEDQLKQRRKLMSEIDNTISKEELNLQGLVKNKKQLQTLLTQLQRKNNYDGQAFGKLRHQLPWPIKGKILSNYGEPIKDSQLRTSGIVINAKSGDSVRAIAPGKVVFADWMPGLGFVLILDHGKSYMSLYGHNQRLLLPVDAIVEAGEEICTVGDTGGQSQTGLYFAIRHEGKPLNPIDWLR